MQALLGGKVPFLFYGIQEIAGHVFLAVIVITCADIYFTASVIYDTIYGFLVFRTHFPIFERKLYRMHLKINGEHIRGRIMTVCIGSAWGYGQAPSAVPYNGWLDVSVIYRPELLQLFSGIWMLMEGRILNHKVVKPYRTQKIKVLRAQNASVDLDGRILDRHFPLDIGVLHEAITLIIPN